MAGIVAAIVMSAVLWGDRQEAFGGGLRADRFSLLLNIIFLGGRVPDDPARAGASPPPSTAAASTSAWC